MDECQNFSVRANLSNTPLLFSPKYAVPHGFQSIIIIVDIIITIWFSSLSLHEELWPDSTGYHSSELRSFYLS